MVRESKQCRIVSFNTVSCCNPIITKSSWTEYMLCCRPALKKKEEKNQLTGGKRRPGTLASGTAHLAFKKPRCKRADITVVCRDSLAIFSHLFFLDICCCHSDEWHWIQDSFLLILEPNVTDTYCHAEFPIGFLLTGQKVFGKRSCKQESWK